MRIKSLQLSWFRGAADPIALEADCKSMVIYGENGSGKSSFVDAVEYILNNGRINHLAHEYSGKRQERAIHNTHKPQDRPTEVVVKFKNNSELKVEIKQNGTATSSGADEVSMNTWSYRRTILRQDEVATFVHDTKGDKYSALLPLLGLDQMANASENLRQLVKSIETNSNLKEIKAALQNVETRRKLIFKSASDEQIIQKIEALFFQYCADSQTTDVILRCKEIETAIGVKSSQFSSDYACYLVVKDISQLELSNHVSTIRLANSKLAGTVEPLIIEKLAVLQSTDTYVEKLRDEDGKEVKCPACGRDIAVDALHEHVQAEKGRLQEIIDIFDARKKAIEALCDDVKALKSNLAKKEVKVWRDGLVEGHFAENIATLEKIDAEAVRCSCDEATLGILGDNLLPLVNEAALVSKNAPPDVKILLDDKQIVETGKAIIESAQQSVFASRVDAMISFTKLLEQDIRDEIRSHTEKILGEISVDIQGMWDILHPGKSIEKVHLYLPTDVDKAIDIGIKFHGIDQPSPRLTLSEGNRNSLGLSIFMSMAKREADKDRPLFLDDVIVSLDRNHRGMVVDLLEKEFANRQVIVLTHDREWYTELRHQLDGKNWVFKTLLPYETPDIGIRWSHKTTTFDDARSHLKDRPDSAGNDARKIMDVELALIAERLQINFPYLRAEKNDKRMAHEFLERIVGSGTKCFQKRVGNDYVVYSDAIDALQKADRLIVSWANRASHTFDVVRPEAEKLIDSSEKALAYFKCSSCGKNIWFAESESAELVQCQCGEIRWRYGKDGASK